MGFTSKLDQFIRAIEFTQIELAVRQWVPLKSPNGCATSCNVTGQY